LGQPVGQALKIGGEGAELAHRLGVAFDRHRHEVTALATVDAGSIELDALEQRMPGSASGRGGLARSWRPAIALHADCPRVKLAEDARRRSAVKEAFS
jgi:hypothetical protein